MDIRVNNTTDGSVETEIEMTVKPYNFEEDYEGITARKVVIQPGVNVYKLVLTVPDARLWWTWDPWQAQYVYSNL